MVWSRPQIYINNKNKNKNMNSEFQLLIFLFGVGGYISNVVFNSRFASYMFWITCNTLLTIYFTVNDIYLMAGMFAIYAAFCFYGIYMSLRNDVASSHHENYNDRTIITPNVDREFIPKKFRDNFRKY